MGKYFSAQWLRTKVLKQTEDDIKEMDNQMKREIEDGIIPDPNMPLDPGTGMPVDQLANPEENPNSEMNLGAPVNEPDIQKSSDKATQVKMPKGGEI